MCMPLFEFGKFSGTKNEVPSSGTIPNSESMNMMESTWSIFIEIKESAGNW